MLKCEVCGKSTGLLASIRGISHAQCETMPVFRGIDRGEFKSFDDDAEILLEHDEHCLAVVKGCAMVGFAPEAEDARGAAAGHDSKATAEGLVKKEVGSLFVTDRRVSFMGTFDARTILLSTIVDIRCSNDILTIVAGERQSASHFSMASPRRLQITAAVIKKLAELFNTNQRPIVFEGPRRTYGMQIAKVA